MSLHIGMKPCSTLVALFVLLLSSASFGEEKPLSVLTVLSSTTISGYVNTSVWWQRHVCRPVRPVRAQRVFQVSTNGVIREIGYAVRCRHGAMFVPNAANRRVFPALNGSSRFSFGATTPRIDYQTQMILIEASRTEHRLPPTLPPVPPYRGTNYPPVVVMPPGSTGGSYYQIRSVLGEQSYQRHSSAVLTELKRLYHNSQRGRVVPPLPPTDLTPTLQ